MTPPRPPRACHAPRGVAGAGIRRFECSCKLSGQQQAPGVSGPAGHPLLSSVSHLLPSTRVILVSKVFFLVKNEDVDGVSDLQGDEVGGGYRVKCTVDERPGISICKQC